MALEDPFYAVKEETCRALERTRGLFARWIELHAMVASGNSVVTTPTFEPGLQMLLDSHQELEWTTNDLSDALRSLGWDIEDLEDTIRIVESNQDRFMVNNRELKIRRSFIEQTSEEVKIMKDRLNISRARDHDPITGQSVIDRFSPEKSPPAVHGTTKYSKLKNQTDSPNRQFVQSPVQMDSPNRQFVFSPIYNQNSMMRHLNDDHLEMNDNHGTLKTVSRQIDSEFDERQVMLDEFNNEMEIITDSKLDSTIKKMAKVLHISNDRRQWVAIGVLTAVLLVLATFYHRF